MRIGRVVSLTLSGLLLIVTAVVSPQSASTAVPSAAGPSATAPPAARPQLPPGAGYEQLRAAAERHAEEGSYALANALYARAQELELSVEQQRWVQFRLADTAWRAAAGSSNADTTDLDAARAQLEELIRTAPRQEDHDRVWAVAHESLGDFWWARRDTRDWGQGWAHYEPALDWWAGSTDIDEARERYLGIVWTIAEPPGRQSNYYYGYYGNVLPVQVLENVLRIAASDEDRARAHFLLAMTLRQQGGTQAARQRTEREFAAALEAGDRTDWRDDALYHYGVWLASNGRVVRTAEGQWRSQPDYLAALELFRQLRSEYRKGQTRYWDDAGNQIDVITRPTLAVSTSSFFLPGSEIELQLGWRNVKSAQLKLYPIQLHRSVDLTRRDDLSSSEWLQAVELGLRQPLLSWSVDTEDAGLHEPGQRAIPLRDKLPLGAYVIEAVASAPGAGSTVRSRDLVLVTDTSLLLKTVGDQALVYVSDTDAGAPLGNAAVALWERHYADGDWRWRRTDATTGDDGIATFRLTRSNNNVELFVASAQTNRQAFSTGSSSQYRRARDNWSIYAFTDRAAYRPGDSSRWKLVARRYDGSVYSTPANDSLWYQIRDPRGAEVEARTVKLNAFGSAWGELELSASMPLGEYRITFRDRPNGSHIGEATLLRLEEYKLPEFKVTVATPEGPDGRRATFRLGDTVQADIRAEYYFGGAVANATVEVLVYQSPYYHTWRPQRQFAWYYDDMDPRANWNGGGGQVVKRAVLSTDPDGIATISFDTPNGGAQDFEYRIEARVTDASRREIVASDTVRVTRLPYFVQARPRHQIYRPGDEVVVDLSAVDANRQPAQVHGTVTVTRDSWREVWVDPSGREVSGPELRALQRSGTTFPRVNGRLWEMKFRGYEREEVLTRQIGTDAEGQAELSFSAPREGYYSVAFASLPADGAQVTSQTAVWVADNATTELGYRHGGLGIIVDKDTFRVGQTAAVMLTTDSPDRYVLFSVEGEDLYSYRLVHVTGTAKLVQVELQERHVPNIYLAAAMVAGQQVYSDVKQVVVPPTRNFLQVEVTADAEQYQPGERGQLTVRVRDHEGRPVAAEIALGLVDEATYYIQQEYAADPRQHFFGTKRSHRVRMISSFQHKRYAELVKSEDGAGLVDRRVQDLQRLQALGYAGEDERRDLDAILYDGNFASGQLPATRSMAADMVGRGGRFREGELAQMEVSEAMASAPGPQAESAPQAAVQVRSDFRATALWQPDVVTGADGTATVELTYPDSLTGWRATARAATAGSQFGVATANTRTQKPLIVRLQAPRFFVVGDTATISALLNNNTDAAMTVQPKLTADGLSIDGAGDALPEQVVASAVRVPAGGEARVDWTVRVTAPGPVRLAVEARSDDESDAMERRFLAHDHGIEKLVATAGKLRGDDLAVTLDLPAARRAGSTKLVVQITPSLAVTMLDSLPYLIDYPYGCTEQTMSRFLPAVITARTLGDLGLDPGEVMGRVFGGIEPEHVEATQRRGQRDLERLDDMVRAGLQRLYDFQHDDGGWGWWKPGDSDHFMSAYVVWGLVMARDAGIDLRDDVLTQGVRYLELEIVEEEEQYDIQAWMLHALSAYSASQQARGASYAPEIPLSDAFDNLWERRDRLNAYSRALLALSAHQLERREQALVLVRNLENGAQRDDSPDTSIIQRGGTQAGAATGSPATVGTAHWGEDGLWWRWSDGGVEATSFALRALLAIDPDNALIEPVTNWLIKNRRGAQWSNTRDTAITVFALNDYLRVSGELTTDLEYELLVNGTSVARQRVAGDDILRAPSRFVIDPELIGDSNEIRIVRHSGDGPLYFAAQATFFSLEEPVTAAGNEIFVRRQYYRLVGRPSLLKGFTYEKQPVRDGDVLTSGERVEVVVSIEAKNNYEYLVFEDLKPAGLESVQVRSGEPMWARELKSGAVRAATDRNDGEVGAGRPDGDQLGERPAGDGDLGEAGREQGDYTGRTRWVHQELRDRKVALFLDKLPEGLWEIRYQLRAEVPGQFHALPLVGHAMYVPEIRANGQELRLSVVDGS